MVRTAPYCSCWKTRWQEQRINLIPLVVAMACGIPYGFESSFSCLADPRKMWVTTSTCDDYFETVDDRRVRTFRPMTYSTDSTDFFASVLFLWLRKAKNKNNAKRAGRWPFFLIAYFIPDPLADRVSCCLWLPFLLFILYQTSYELTKLRMGLLRRESERISSQFTMKWTGAYFINFSLACAGFTIHNSQCHSISQ